ncbi:MAG: rhomboid family intramembrane serine protease [Aigarchaeota archaeon]|nr:rhomboid family intramembrane serine protease [Aigarchaeota archaeon]
MASREGTLTATTLLVLVNVGMYLVTSFLGGNPISTAEDVLVLLGQSNYAVIRYGWYWQLLTAMFVHVNIAHIGFNMVFLYLFGKQADQLFGRRMTLLIYLASGFAGNLLSLVAGQSLLSAGASGAIFGLFGSVIMYSGKLGSGSVRGALAEAAVMFFLNITIVTNVWAHGGGLIVGLLVGYLLARTMSRRMHAYRSGMAYTAAAASQSIDSIEPTPNPHILKALHARR